MQISRNPPPNTAADKAKLEWWYGYELVFRVIQEMESIFI